MLYKKKKRKNYVHINYAIKMIVVIKGKEPRITKNELRHRFFFSYSESMLFYPKSTIMYNYKTMRKIVILRK